MTFHVLVAGDQLTHEHIAEIAGDGPPRDGRWGAAARQHSPGGSRLLASLIAALCQDLEITLQTAAPQPSSAVPEARCRAVHIWTPQPKLAGGPDRVWRIDRSLAVEDSITADPEPAQVGCEEPPRPLDLVVLDEAGLFLHEEACSCPPAIVERGLSADGEILFAAGRPIGQSPMWQTLLQEYAERLTVILPVSSLRARHAAISQQLSWDRTIEDLDRELTRGASFVDLGRVRRLVVYFPAAGAALYQKMDGGGLRMERFLYHPEDLEEAFYTRRPGRTLIPTALLAAAVARHVLAPATYPAFVALGRALGAIRAVHEQGAGPVKGHDQATALAAFAPALEPAAVARMLLPGPDIPNRSLPEGQFRSAFPQRLVRPVTTRGPRPGVGTDTGGIGSDNAHASDLLQDVTGRGYEYVAAMATQVVLQGVGPALAAAPKARYGALTTVDREEIERINEIRRLMMTYQASETDRKPLSIAVFGPPGSGKSFAIKQLARDLFGGSQEVHEFNLSQLGTREELHEAFNQVRDATVRGRIPLVFWDEFDTGGLAWLKEFLAPMQDAEYRSGGHLHPFAKAVFVFAGGTAADFQTFDRTGTPGSAGEAFRAAKGPDFISRLRGYVNIKGPNPTVAAPLAGRASVAGRAVAPLSEDVAHLVRRAIILRSIIERNRPELVEPGTGRALVSTGVTRAFLRVKSYLHGARSIEAVVAMSSLSGTKHFGLSELPSTDLLRLHVTPDFITLAHEGELEETTTEFLAQATHQAWLQGRLADGWVPGAEISSELKTHPLLVPYTDLPEANRERNNRQPARVALAKLSASGYRVVPSSPGPAAGALGGDEEVTPSDQELWDMTVVEHDIWLRDHLLHGYQYAERRDERLRLHPAIRPFAQLPEADKLVNRAIVERSLEALLAGGYRLVRTASRSELVAVGVTGHRHLEEPEAIAAAVSQALRHIAAAYGHRPVLLLSALAEGADRLVAEAALVMPEAKLTAVLPATRLEYADEFGPPGSASRLHFESLLARASEVIEAVQTRATREHGYEAAAEVIVDHCDVLLAVWDGQAARGKGGTGEVVAMAREKGKPVVVIDARGNNEQHH